MMNGAQVNYNKVFHFFILASIFNNIVCNIYDVFIKIILFNLKSIY